MIAVRNPSFHGWFVRFEEPIAVLGITKSFGSAGSRGGESSRQIAIGKTSFQICTTEELMQEPGIEAVACTNCIYGVHF